MRAGAILVAAMMMAVVPAVVYSAGRTPSPPAPVVLEIAADVVGTSKTLLTLEVCPEPLMLRGGPIHAQAYEALRALNMSFMRLQPWFPYPRLGIAELEPPQADRTFWNFELIDPIFEDFYESAEGRPTIVNMPIPDWLFKGPRRPYPQDPNAIDWQYEIGPDVGREFRDPTFEEASDYFQRVASWYIKGGFIDELGGTHTSGHHFTIDYWEVLNEEDEGGAHEIDPQRYTALYDVIVGKLQKIDRKMKFSALALNDAQSVNYFEYFLNHKNHKDGIPLDMVSYHKYIIAEAGKTAIDWRRDMFADADRFLTTVTRIQRIRDRLSPETKTFISELGVQWGDELANITASIQDVPQPYPSASIPKEYWSLGAAVLAYTYLGVLRSGVDMVAASELVDYPGMMAGGNLIDWNSGKPNAIYWTVKLLHDELPPGTKLLKTRVDSTAVAAQAFRNSRGKRLLLINKTSASVKIIVEGAKYAKARIVDISTGLTEPRDEKFNSNELELEPQSVTLISWPSVLQ
jgi:hypothetical protein